MAEVIVTFKIIPETPDADYESIASEAEKIISSKGRLEKTELKPLAFGLKELLLYAVFPEEIGGEIDKLSDKMDMINRVDNCEVIDVRRAIELD